MSYAAQALAMAIPRDPTSAEIAFFLSTRNCEQMVQLVQAIREPAAQAALTTSLLLAPPLVASRNPTPEKAKKALNAFVGFRCYYISISNFRPWPMKKLSNPMGIMWEADPNKSLWSLMTKAWSTIRDQVGKDKAPLNQFFRTICPYLNMPSPDSYLERHGWSVTIDPSGGPSLFRDKGFVPEPIITALQHTALSVEDIIAYCQSMGYAQEYRADSNTASPTFLGQSLNQSAGKNTPVKISSHTVDTTYENRLAARNKRRNKRQNDRTSGTASILQEQIAIAHATKTTDRSDNDLPDSEPLQFYDELTGLLVNQLANSGDGVGLELNAIAWPSNLDSDIPLTTDWNAFRFGADENATLPFFDPIGL